VGWGPFGGTIRANPLVPKGFPPLGLVSSAVYRLQKHEGNMMNPKEFAEATLTVVKEEMKDLDEVVRLCLVALYTNGHVLLEGNPGLGKTALVRALGSTLDFEFGRIQFTPDLMPADITGTLMPVFKDGAQKLEFVHGPIFKSLLLADEINRATPKTQSAMLEAMAEQQVTVLGESRKLPNPFMVLATQNPIDHEGTYTLPEAQSDRFMFKILMPTPLGATLKEIMAKTAGRIAILTRGLADNAPAMADHTTLRVAIQTRSLERHGQYAQDIKARLPIPSLEAHIVNLLLASNRQFDELARLDTLDREQTRNIRQLADGLFSYGLGPRAATALMLGAKAWSFFWAAPTNEQADGSDLARVVLPALRHRLKLRYNWIESYRPNAPTDDQHEAALLDELIAEFCILTAPKANGYQYAFKQALDQVLHRKHGGA
jgi:MoxR-like ATPase